PNIGCPTRWNSTYNAIEQLIANWDVYKKLVVDLRLDCPTPALPKLVTIKDCLAPLADATNLLETNLNSLPMLIPALEQIFGRLADLNCSHAASLEAYLRRCFSWALDVDAVNFSPVAYTAMLLGTKYGKNMVCLQSYSKVLRQVSRYLVTQYKPSTPAGIGHYSPPTKKSRLDGELLILIEGEDLQTPEKLVEDVLTSIRHSANYDPETFWLQERPDSWKWLQEFRADICMAPCSQAFVERVFSMCGFLSKGRRNRLGHARLEQRALGQGKTRQEKKSKHRRFICRCGFMVQMYQRPLGEWVVSRNQDDHVCQTQMCTCFQKGLVIPGDHQPMMSLDQGYLPTEASQEVEQLLAKPSFMDNLRQLRI
ncbi:TRP-like ion channel Pkd2, partial [Cichlidogyrus casuarinus]